MAELISPSIPLGIDQSYIFSEPSHFRVLNLGQFWVRGDYIVNKDDGSRFLKVDHKFWRTRREVTDANGSTAFRIRMNKTNPRMVYYLERPDETRVAEFRVRWNNLLKIQADLHFTNADGADVVLSLRSNEKWYEKFDIFYQEQRVAYVERHDYNCKVKKEEGASQTYDLNVAANLDTMLASFVVIALDDGLTIYRGASLANPGMAAAIGITAAVRGSKDLNASSSRKTEQELGSDKN